MKKIYLSKKPGYVNLYDNDIHALNETFGQLAKLKPLNGNQDL